MAEESNDYDFCLSEAQLTACETFLRDPVADLNKKVTKDVGDVIAAAGMGLLSLNQWSSSNGAWLARRDGNQPTGATTLRVIVFKDKGSERATTLVWSTSALVPGGCRAAPEAFKRWSGVHKGFGLEVAYPQGVGFSAGFAYVHESGKGDPEFDQKKHQKLHSVIYTDLLGYEAEDSMLTEGGLSLADPLGCYPLDAPLLSRFMTKGVSGENFRRVQTVIDPLIGDDVRKGLSASCREFLNRDSVKPVDVRAIQLVRHHGADIVLYEAPRRDAKFFPINGHLVTMATLCGELDVCSWAKAGEPESKGGLPWPQQVCPIQHFLRPFPP